MTGGGGISVHGNISHGRGKATKRKFEEHPALTAYFGRPCRPGTANLVLSQPIVFAKHERLPFSRGYDAFWAVTVDRLDCIAFRYKFCPLHVVELISPTFIRAHLEDCDTTRVELRGPIRTPGFFTSLIWHHIWSGHEHRYYNDDDFVQKSHRYRVISRYATQPAIKW